MRVFVLGVLTALSLAIPSAQAQQVNPLILNGKPATIQGIGLGDGPESCKGTIKPEELGQHIGNMFYPDMILQSCRNGTQEDRLDVTYDSTGTKVVAVVRTLYLSTQEVSTQDFFASVEKFYGPADLSDYSNWTVAYGDFEAPNGRNAKLLSYGTGLVIAGYICGVQVDCPSAFRDHARITFKLSDQDAYTQAVAEGKQALANSKSDRANAIIF